MPRIYHFVICLAMLMVPTVGAWAQIRRLEPAGVARTELGVPQFQIRGADALGLTAVPSDLHVLPDGRVLVVAGRTIAWGDGVRWESFRQSTEERPSQSRHVAVAPDGTIYIGVRGGISRIEFGEDRCWRTRMVVAVSNLDDSGPADDQREVVEVGDEWLWHGRSGPFRLWHPGSSVRMVGQLDQIAHAFFFRGAYYASSMTTGSLWRLGSDAMHPVLQAPDVWINDTVISSTPFDSGRLLVGTFGRGLRLFDGERFQPFASDSVLAAPARISALCSAGDGFFAAAVDTLGIVFFDRQGRVIQIADRSVDHRLGGVRQLVAGADGTVWGLLKEGIVRVRFPSHISDFVPLFGTAINTVNVCRYGSELWFMGDGRIFRGVYDEGGRLTRLRVDSPPDAYVTALSYAGGFQIAGTDKGSFYWAESGWVPFAPSTNNLRVAVPEAFDGRWLYLADREIGWLHLRSGRLEREAFPVPELSRTFHAVRDENGAVWTEMGSGRIGRVQIVDSHPQLTVFTAADGLFPSWCQLFEIDGVARVNVSGRTLRFDKASQRFLPDDEFLRRFPQCREINCRPGRDALGRIWVVADNVLRIYRETPEGLVPDPAERSFRGHMPFYFTFEDNGVVWTQEDCGLFRYDPAALELEAGTLSARITQVDLAGSGRTFFTSQGALPDLSFDDRSLVAHFIAVDAPMDAAVTFEVQLEGVDPGWNNVGSAGSAAYRNLHEGAYRLLVRPCIGDLPGKTDTLVFFIMPPWYRAWWAYLSYVLGCAALVGGFLAMQRRKRRQLESLVGERTAALNESNRQLERQLATIRTLSQAIEQSP
ncbi:MAG TPA: hypothetical protein PLZ74_10970, partial [Kiritimatiellia bacterium]|nr:hypothetical protein [Kiritimatiellia bacterium]